MMGGAGLASWVIFRGFRTGAMGVPGKFSDIGASRQTDPRNFWINTTINVSLLLGFLAYVIFVSGLSNT